MGANAQEPGHRFDGRSGFLGQWAPATAVGDRFRALSSHFLSLHLFRVVQTAAPNSPSGVLGMSRRSSFSLVESVLRLTSIPSPAAPSAPQVLPTPGSTPFGSEDSKWC